MKPNFALDLSHDGISLYQRTALDWRLVGEARFADPDLAERVGWLRATALSLAPQGIATKLILPESQVRYLEIEAPAKEAGAKRRQIRAGLEGRTPYAVEDLAFDWSGEGAVVQVAVVARETLEEAEAFAADNRFVPLAFVAVPEPGQFDGEPFFGQTRVAAALLPDGTRVERDARPVRAWRASEAAAGPVETPGPELPPAPGPEAPTPEAPEPDVPGPELPPPGRPEPEVPDPTPPAPDLPDPGIPRPGPTEVPDPGPDNLPEPGPVELPDPGPVEVPDSLPPSSPHQPEVMAGPVPALARNSGRSLTARAGAPRRGAAMRPGSPEDAAATLAPADLAGPGPSRSRSSRHLALRLTGGLVAVLLIAWMLAGLLPARTAADLGQTAVTTAAPEAQAPAAGGTTGSRPAAKETHPVLAPTPSQARPQTTQPSKAAEVPAPKPAASPTDGAALVPARQTPVSQVKASTAAPDLLAALRHELIAAKIPRFIPPMGGERLALVETAPGKRAKLAADPPRRRPGTALPVAALAATSAARIAADPPRARPGSTGAVPQAVAQALAEEMVPDAKPRLSARRAMARPDRIVRAAEAENPPVAVAMDRPRPRPRDFSAGVNAALAAVVVPEPMRPAPVLPAPVVAPALAPVVAAAEPVRPARTKPSPAPLPSVVAQAAQPSAQLRLRRTPVTPEMEEELESSPVIPTIPTRASVARQATMEDALNLRQVNLIGVYGTANNRRALIRLSNGRLQRVKVGDMLDGGQVAAISDREIRYVKSGRALVLSLPRT